MIFATWKDLAQDPESFVKRTLVKMQEEHPAAFNALGDIVAHSQEPKESLAALALMLAVFEKQDALEQTVEAV